MIESGGMFFQAGRLREFRLPGNGAGEENELTRANGENGE